MFPNGEDTSTSKFRLDLLCVSKCLWSLERYSDDERERFECNICRFVKIYRPFDLRAELKAHIRAVYANQILHRKFLTEANPTLYSSHAKEPDGRDMKKI